MCVVLFSVIIGLVTVMVIIIITTAVTSVKVIMVTIIVVAIVATWLELRVSYGLFSIAVGGAVLCLQRTFGVKTY